MTSRFSKRTADHKIRIRMKGECIRKNWLFLNHAVRRPARRCRRCPLGAHLHRPACSPRVQPCARGTEPLYCIRRYFAPLPLGLPPRTESFHARRHLGVLQAAALRQCALLLSADDLHSSGRRAARRHVYGRHSRAGGYRLQHPLCGFQVSRCLEQNSSATRRDFLWSDRCKSDRV